MKQLRIALLGLGVIGRGYLDVLSTRAEEFRRAGVEPVLVTAGDSRGMLIDADGLDPSLIPSTGTPQPDGLSWRQTIDVIRSLATSPQSRLIGADITELVASPHPPGSDAVAARLATKILAFWWPGRTRGT